MVPFLPVEEMQKEIDSAVAEFLAGSQAVQKEQDELETELVQALEHCQVEDLKKKLYE